MRKVDGLGEMAQIWSSELEENTVAGEIAVKLEGWVDLGLTGYVCVSKCTASVPYIKTVQNRVFQYGHKFLDTHWTKGKTTTFNFVSSLLMAYVVEDFKFSPASFKLARERWEKSWGIDVLQANLN